VIVKDNALAIQDRGEQQQYNQLSGRDMTALFRNGDLYYVLVEGNAESLYYLVEKDSTIIGLNKTESPYLSMDIENEQIKRIKLWSTTTAVTTPLSLLKPEDSRLKGFFWVDYLRPTGPNDISAVTNDAVRKLLNNVSGVSREKISLCNDEGCKSYTFFYFCSI